MLVFADVAGVDVVEQLLSQEWQDVSEISFLDQMALRSERWFL